MQRYFVKTPWLVKKVFPSYYWDVKGSDAVYLSFDDGPHPEITPWVLEQLRKYQAKASFFCIGKNVAAHPDIFASLILDGHAVGNHTYNHLNGWQTKDEVYLEDVKSASAIIDSDLFRPPYGRIRQSQAKKIPAFMPKENARIIMWDVLSADFDAGISPQDCFYNVANHIEPGSIIVFHDSEKAFNNLKYALPATLEFLEKNNLECKKLGDF
ncbi:MAG: polysaccharide deacetylase family protein [Flavisolibacter sp.]